MDTRRADDASGLGRPGRRRSCSYGAPSNDLHDASETGVAVPLEDLSFKFGCMQEFKTLKLLTQTSKGHRQLRDRWSTGASADLAGRVRLQNEHAAWSQRDDDPSVQILTEPRREVGKDGDDAIPARDAELTGREIVGHRVNIDRSLLGEPTGLGDAGLGQIDARDLEPLARKEDGIPALTFGQAQHAPTRQAADVFPQELVGFGAVVVVVGAIALLPRDVRGRRVR